MKKTDDSKKESDEKKESSSDRLIGFLVGSSLIVVIGSFLVPMYQVYTWLKDGIWTTLTTKIVCSKILPNGFYLWLSDDSWLGVKRTIEYITCDMSLFLFLFLIGCVLFFGILKIAD